MGKASLDTLVPNSNARRGLMKVSSQKDDGARRSKSGSTSLVFLRASQRCRIILSNAVQTLRQSGSECRGEVIDKPIKET